MTSALIGTGFLIIGTAGTTIATQIIGTFANYISTSTSTSDYLITANWGDETPPETLNSITALGTTTTFNNFSISASHTYYLSGLYSIQIYVQYPTTDPISSITFTSQVNISPGLITATTQPILSSGPIISGNIVEFTSSNIRAMTTDYTPTIDWGDGTPMSYGIIIQNAGTGTPFDVLGSHTYTKTNTYNIIVNIQDNNSNYKTNINNTANIIIPQVIMRPTLDTSFLFNKHKHNNKHSHNHIHKSNNKHKVEHSQK